MEKKFIHEWIAVFDNVKSEAILGNIIKKDKQHNNVIVEHWIHQLDDSPHSSSFQKPIVKRCLECEINESKYNISKVYRNRDGTNHRKTYTCTKLYKNITTVAVSKISKIDSETYVLYNSIFELKQLAKNLYRDYKLIIVIR